LSPSVIFLFVGNVTGRKDGLTFNASATDSFREGEEVSIRTAFYVTAGMITNGLANFR
jgi:hypothetical protein